MNENDTPHICANPRCARKIEKGKGYGIKNPATNRPDRYCGTPCVLAHIEQILDEAMKTMKSLRLLLLKKEK